MVQLTVTVDWNVDMKLIWPFVSFRHWRRKRGAAGVEAPLKLEERGQRPPELMAF